MSALSTHHKQTKRSETKKEQSSTKEKNSNQVTKSSERQEQSLTQAQIDPLRQGQRLDAIDQETKHDSSKTEVTLDAVMLEVERKRGKPEARNKADTPQAKLPLFDHFSQKFSPLLAHAHIKPKICLNLPLKSCYAMNVVQRV